MTLSKLSDCISECYLIDTVTIALYLLNSCLLFLRFLLTLCLLSAIVQFIKYSATMSEQYGSCEGPEAMYVKLVSSDGHEFIIKREHALTSGTIKAMLSGPGKCFFLGVLGDGVIPVPWNHPGMWVMGMSGEAIECVEGVFHRGSAMCTRIPRLRLPKMEKVHVYLYVPPPPSGLRYGNFGPYSFLS